MMPLNFARGVASVVPGGVGPHTQASQFVDYAASVVVNSASTTLETAFNSYVPTVNSTNFGHVYGAITDLGYTVLATPKYGAQFESMPGSANLSNLPNGGYFKDNVFRFDNYQNSGATYGNHGVSNGAPNWNAPMHLRTLSNYSSTHGQSAFDGHPFLCMSFWSSNTYYGSLLFIKEMLMVVIPFIHRLNRYEFLLIFNLLQNMEQMQLINFLAMMVYGDS